VTNAAGNETTASCDLAGRYVSLSLTGTDVLALAEVALFALPTLGKEIVLRKQYTTQSSTFKDNSTNVSQPSNNSIDGDYYSKTNSA